MCLPIGTLPSGMKICVVGTGYVGLVSGVCLAAKGHEVVCVDVRAEVVKTLNEGPPHIHESALPKLLDEVRNANRFRATLSLEEALANAALVLLAVGTPSSEGVIDLTYIRQAAGEIGALLPKLGRFISVIVKSTVVPGTTDTVVKKILEERSGYKLGQFGLGMNPEFLREGEAVGDFMNPDRIVFGHEDEQTRQLLEELYRPWTCEKIAVNTRTAEMIKYANNCLLATQISAVNELANLAAALGGVDIMDVMRGVHADKRWNPIKPDGSRVRPEILTYLIPGCGFGGSCFPKDVQALRSQGRTADSPMQLLDAVLDVNDRQPSQVATLLRRKFKSLAGKRVLVLGVAFKPETDDVRESASQKVISDLSAEGAVVSAHDPVGIPNARKAWPDLKVNYVEDWESDLKNCDAVIIATKWPVYRKLTSLSSELNGKIIVDARRFFQASEFPTSEYLAIGYTPAK